MTQNISTLNLSSKAKKAAEELLKKHPEVEFTSGRRDLKEQAEAMAGNVVKNRKWIGQTYAKSTVSADCQKWVDDHPEAKTKADIAKGLHDALKKSGSKVSALSRHLTGDAFDVQPVTKNASAIKATIKKLPGLHRFLEKEGGLVRWHAQF